MVWLRNDCSSQQCYQLCGLGLKHRSITIHHLTKAGVCFFRDFNLEIWQGLKISCSPVLKARWRGNLRGGRTKCQPDKMPTGHNANQRLAFCPDLFLWLAFCLSQLFGWHFVRTISTCFGILSKSWKSPPPPLLLCGKSRCFFTDKLVGE